MHGIQGGGRAESIGQLQGGNLEFRFGHTRQRGGIGRSLSQPMEYPSAADSEQVAHTGGELDSGILEKRFNLTV